MLPICAVDWTDFKFINLLLKTVYRQVFAKLVVLPNCVELVALGRMDSLCEANRPMVVWLFLESAAPISKRTTVKRRRRVRGGEEEGGESVLISSSCCSTRRSYIHETSSSECVLRIVSASQSSHRFYQQVLYPSKVGFVCFNVICMLEFSLGRGLLFW